MQGLVSYCQETEFRGSFFLPAGRRIHMNTVSINQSLATFASVADMDKTVRQFLFTHGHKLTDSAKQVLLKLARYSCKVVGVSWPEAKTIAPALGISVRTFWRAMKQLESFEIIKRISGRNGRRKKDGTIGGNAYQIQPLNNLKDLPSASDVTRDGTWEMAHGEERLEPTAVSTEKVSDAPETKYFKTGFSTEENLNTGKREIRIPDTRIWRKVPKNVPKEFASPIMRDTADGKVAFKLWGKALLLKNLCGFCHEDTVTDIAIETWKRTRTIFKERDFNSFCGIFYGALKRVTIEKFGYMGTALCSSTKVTKPEKGYTEATYPIMEQPEVKNTTFDNIDSNKEVTKKKDFHSTGHLSQQDAIEMIKKYGATHLPKDTLDDLMSAVEQVNFYFDYEDMRQTSIIAFEKLFKGEVINKFSSYFINTLKKMTKNEQPSTRK